MILAYIFHNGIASEKRVDEHMVVNRYWFPNLDIGNGSTQSTITWLKGSSMAGIG